MKIGFWGRAAVSRLAKMMGEEGIGLVVPGIKGRDNVFKIIIGSGDET
jgi:hypothetical protein